MNELGTIVADGLLSTDRPICLAILAMGGQGGGVLADWIVAVAESQGWSAQSTSVPGVAQRTGATIYYIELLSGHAGMPPTLSLLPTPGDVDVVITAELMEAGRSVLRGLVTPDRTTLITSTHRSLAVSEKVVSGDGAGDPAVVTKAAGIAAKRVIALDMQNLAVTAGSVISASLFGALAGADVLPFDRAAFEAAIRAGGKGVEPSLRAFAAGFAAAGSKYQPAPIVRLPHKRFSPLPDATGHEALDALVARIRGEFPPALQPMLATGVRHLVDYQDPAYAGEYLDQVFRFTGAGDAAPGLAAAKYIARAFAYDDVIRVADLKTRATRFARIDAEMGAGEADLLTMTEFMHPRGEEVVGILPAGLAHWVLARPWLFRLVNRVVSRPRRVRTGTIFGFLTLYLVAGLRSWRRGTLRHAQEMDHIATWLTLAESVMLTNPGLATEILNTRRLVKGYSDTHARGAAKFDLVLSAVRLLEHRADGADWLRRLREAAMAGEGDALLEGALRTIATLDHAA